MVVSRRLVRWVERRFPAADVATVLDLLRDLPDGVVGVQDPERVHASLVLGGGDLHAVRQRLELARSDWRDALVGAGLGGEDWRDRVDEVLGAAR